MEDDDLKLVVPKLTPLLSEDKSPTYFPHTVEVLASELVWYTCWLIVTELKAKIVLKSFFISTLTWLKFTS